MVFILIMTALVYATQVGQNEGVKNYLDALYVTVASLTTTGYGDIVLVGAVGKILSIIIMVLGISLFLRLVQAIIRPSRVKSECERCGLLYHEPDAVHCKHCGEIVKLPNSGRE